MGAEALHLDQEMARPDAPEVALPRRAPRHRRAWSALWPRLAAIVCALLAWQAVVLTGWRPAYLLPGPGPVLARLAEDARQPAFAVVMGITMQRALIGYSVAVVLGAVLGALVARNWLFRRAIGSLITGLQTMPSIAWFPLAILVFGPNETAILFVVVLGAAPAVANGLIAGIDQIPPLLLRYGKVLGARRLSMYRHIILPASLPAFLGGLKQGWAFAWRGLMAGELLVIVGNRLSLGARLQVARQLSDAEGLVATMLVILAIGMLVDGVFNIVQGQVRNRWGLAGD